METERRIFRNTVYLSAGKGIGDLFSFVFLAYYGRIFGATSLGKYSFAMSLVGLLTILATLGFHTLIIREVAKKETQGPKYVGNLMIARGILSVILWAMIGLGAHLSSLDRDMVWIIFLISGYQIFNKLAGLVKACLIAFEKMLYSALLELYHKAFIMVIGVTTAILYKDPLIALAVYPMAAFTMFIISLTLYWKLFRWPDFSLDYSFIKSSVFKAFPFFLIVVIGQIYDRIGIVFLTFMKGTVSTGIFSAGDRLLVASYSGIVIFSGVLFPYMAKLWVSDKDQLYRLCERSIRFVFAALLSMAVFFFVLSEHIIFAIFGRSFEESTLVLKWLVWALVFMGLNLVISRLLIASEQEKKLVKIRTMVYFCYCIASLLLIWKFSYLGLAWAKIMTEAALFFTTVFLAFDSRDVYNLFKMMLAPLASCILSIVLFQYIKDFTVWFVFPAVFGTYLILMFLFKGIFVHDFIYLKEIVFGKKYEELI
jgi:O-antigen/teichoic acid export membrane protein